MIKRCKGWPPSKPVHAEHLYSVDDGRTWTDKIPGVSVDEVRVFSDGMCAVCYAAMKRQIKKGSDNGNADTTIREEAALRTGGREQQGAGGNRLPDAGAPGYDA
jgi:hypothetical protein